MARDGTIEPVVLLTKTDLVTPEELVQIVESVRNTGIDAKILTLSSTTGDGIDDFKRMLAAGRTYCLLGSSGVGKTTLINRLIGRDTFDTKAVSGTGEGTHSTSRRQLIILEQGSLLIDTPGMRELGILGASGAVDESFAQIGDLSASCRYADCTHVREPGCAVLSAVESGDLDRKHYESYLKLKKESEYNEMSYLDKRRKDKAFGRFVKTALKQMKK
jgi:ribosome biogenesis GTPase